jgi:hypothetical protein
MAVQFGVVSAAGSFGYIQNFSSNLSADRAYALDENGDTKAAQTHNKKEEISFEYVFSGTAPAVGDTLTISTVKYTVLTVNMTESNTDFKRMSVTAERFTANTVPAA